MITIYGKPDCTYCTAAKTLLASQGVDYTYIDILAENKRDWLIKQGHRTVPQCYDDGVHIGGYTHLQQWCDLTQSLHKDV